MTLLVPIALIGWIPFVVALAAFLPLRRVVIVAVLAGWLFLPVASFDTPGWPNFNKPMAVVFAAWLAVVLFDARRLLALRPQWIDLPVTLVCVSPVVSTWWNAGGAWEAASVFLWHFVQWGAPYLLGRVYLADWAGLRELALAQVAAALLYMPLCLYEMWAGPRLHQMLYGFYPHELHMANRFGGWRPSVFMHMGLMLALWMTAASVIGFWMWRQGQLRGGRLAGWAVLALLLTTIASRSVNAWILLPAGIAILLLTTYTRSRVLVACLLAAVPAFVAVRASGVWQGESTRRVIGPVNPEKAQSLAYRFEHENLIVANASRSPFLGLGRGATAFTSPAGQFVEADSLWVIVYGQFGLVGLAGVLATILTPILLFLRAVPPAQWRAPDLAPAAVWAVVLILLAIDNLVNDMGSPVFLLAAGGLGAASATLLRQNREVGEPQLAGKTAELEG
jgi:hypothetical protein